MFVHEPVLLAASSAAVGLQSALIAAAVSLLVAVLGQYGLARRDRRERGYQRRRTALIDVQNAALELRQALAGFGVLARATPGVRSTELLDAEREFDRALAVLEVRLSRLENAEVADLVTAWRLAAQVSFISVHDVVTRSDEQQAWSALNAAIGNALGHG